MEPRFIDEAIRLAELGPYSSNPRVGAVCVLDGVVVGVGYHHGAGTPHAEVEALAAAGNSAEGSDLYVSLEPCSHFGRTPPCTQAIIEAGVSRVFYAATDPTKEAGGGGEVRRESGLGVSGGVKSDQATKVNREWNHRVKTGLPFDTWKFSQSLDGRVSAQFGERTSISGDSANAYMQEFRAKVGAIVVGTSTFMVDHPSLTARNPDGTLKEVQPIRAVMGIREVAPAGFHHLATRDPEQALRSLASLGVNHVLLEGGPTLAAAFVEVGCINEVISITSPVTFGSGPRSLVTPEPFMNLIRVTSTFVLGPDLVQIGAVG